MFFRFLLCLFVFNLVFVGCLFLYVLKQHIVKDWPQKTPIPLVLHTLLFVAFNAVKCHRILSNLTDILPFSCRYVCYLPSCSRPVGYPLRFVILCTSDYSAYVMVTAVAQFIFSLANTIASLVKR